MTMPGSQPQTPNGFAGELMFEELLRRFLAYQLKMIQENANKPGVTFLDEMFGRWDDDTRLQVKKWFALHTNINVVINYPREDIKLPFIAVVSATENESGEAYLGDYGGQMLIGRRAVQASSSIKLPINIYGQQLEEPDPRPVATHVRQVISIPENHVTRLYIAADDTNVVMAIYAVVKALILVNKMDFDRYAGARNLKMNGGDFEHRPELFPAFAYFKMLTLSYDMNFDVPLSPVQTIGGVDVSFTSYLNGG